MLLTKILKNFLNKTAFQWDAYRRLANRTCFGGHDWMSVAGNGVWPHVSNFEQVSSYDHQMSLAGDWVCPGGVSMSRGT